MRLLRTVKGRSFPMVRACPQIDHENWYFWQVFCLLYIDWVVIYGAQTTTTKTTTRTSQISIFNDKKLYLCMHSTFFIFEHFICPSRPFDGVKSVVLHLYGRRERTWQILNFYPLISERGLQFNFRILRTHFVSMMTLTNDCRNAKLPLQMRFSLSPTSPLLTTLSSLLKIIVWEWGKI